MAQIFVGLLVTMLVVHGPEAQTPQAQRDAAVHPHSSQSSRIACVLALVVSGLGVSTAQDLTLPNKPENTRLAIIGDSGTGSSSQFRVAERLIASRSQFPYEFVLMMGDNLYGGSGTKDYFISGGAAKLREGDVKGPSSPRKASIPATTSCSWKSPRTRCTSR